MSGSEVENGTSIDERLDEVVADYVRAIEAGNVPDRELLLKQNPELAEDLRDFFLHRDRMERLLDPLRSAAARILNVRCPHCHNAIELVDHTQVTSLSCPSCGSNFSLVSDGSEGRFPRGQKKIGQFQLVEQVGMGQFGSVWKARDLTLERTVAIKIPRSNGLDETETEMFLRDARLAAQLHHPNIVGVHEVGKHENVIYIVSDFIQGATLGEWIKARRLTFKQAVGLCVKVARALHHAHEAGVIHRDLKPSNIMMDLTSEPYIVDFGLAKRDSGEITMTIEGQILGTPAYMSPEQARGEGHQADRRADIYSLGVILFQLLTGELPFRGDKQMLLVQIIRDPPPSPRKLEAKVPRDVETICLKCLEKEAHGRYASAEDLAADCERFLNREPVLARPVSRVGRGWRWCKRKPWVAGLSAVVAALLVVIALVSNVGYWNTRSALDIAQQRADTIEQKADTIEQNLYYSEMNRAAIAATELDGLGVVKGLLEKWEPPNTSVDRRGWEWHYLESELHQELVTLTGHTGSVNSLAFSPDGSRLASASVDWSIRIWTPEGKTIHTLNGHRDRVGCVAWNQDASLLASASRDGTVRLWNPDDASTVRILKHAGPVDAVSWSHDRLQIATTSVSNPGDGLPVSIVTVWSVNSGEKTAGFQPARQHFQYLRWNPTQPQIAVGSQSGQLEVLSSVTGDVLQSLKGTVVSWRPDGRALLTGRWSNVIVWDVDENKRLAGFETASLEDCAWSPTGRSIVYTAGYKAVSVSDVKTERVLLTFRGHLKRVPSVCWHPDGHRIVTGDEAGDIKIWDTNTRPNFFPGRAVVSWHPDGSRYASAAGNAAILVDTSTSKIERTLGGHLGDVYSVAWSPDGNQVASVCYAGNIRVWNASSGELVSSAQTEVPYRPGNSRLPTVLSWSPDSRRLAFPQTDQTVRIAEAATLNPIHDLTAAIKPLRTLAWSTDGSRVVAGGHSSHIHLWNADTGQLVNTVEPDVGISAVCWSPDGAKFATAHTDTTVRVRDALTCEPIHFLKGHTSYVHSVSWSPDGARISSADESGSVRIWDANTGQQTLTLSYPSGVPMVAWSPDGRKLAGVGFGGGAAVRIWDTTVEPAESLFW